MLGQVEVTEYATMADCEQHMRQIHNLLKFERDNNHAWVDWKMTCTPKLLLDEQGKIIPGQRYE